jgi:hypothetical protein
MVGAAGFCLGVGWLAADGWVPAAIAALTAVLWIALRRQAGMRVNTAAFLIMIGTSAGGVLGGAQPSWMAAGLFFSLAAWDLADFHDQLESFEPVAGRKALIQKHLLSLGAVGLVSLAAGLLVPLAEVQLRFFWVVVLAAGLVIVFNRLVGQLKNS